MEGLLLPLLLMLVVAIPLVMGTRKQKKAAAQQQELQASLKDGDRVMTTSGLYATVADASDEGTIDLEVADGVVTTWLRQAVREKINPIVEDDAADTGTSDETVTEDTSVQDDTADDEQGAKVAPPLEHGKK